MKFRSLILSAMSFYFRSYSTTIVLKPSPIFANTYSINLGSFPTLLIAATANLIDSLTLYPHLSLLKFVNAVKVVADFLIELTSSS